jgi:two-component sensor histidine kinase
MAENGNQSFCTNSPEADHRIANHLALLSSYVRLKGASLTRRESPLDPAEVVLLLNAISAQIRAVSDLHRILAVGNSRNGVQLGDLLGQICVALKSGIADDVIFTESYASGCALPLDHVLPVAQIFTEIVTNAIKYGHRVGAARRIEIACRKNIFGTVLVAVSDNGPGLANGGSNKAGMGLGTRLIHALSAQIGGSVEFVTTESGVSATLSLASTGPLFDEVPGPGVSGKSFVSNNQDRDGFGAVWL